MAVSQEDRDFGETAVERGFITQDQFDRALTRLKNESSTMAALLVELGFITATQEKTIGRFAVRKGGLNSEELTPDKMIGEELGGCRILQSVGSGGMGTTYRAHHSRLDREVCVKLLHPRLTRIGGMAERFQREARAVAKLSHPNVVQVFDFDQRGALYFMIMEYVPGRNLKEILEATGPLHVSQAVWVVSQVLAGLDAAHELGIVHRDIKPANILFAEESNRVYITDFGTVRMLSSSTSENLSTFGEILGTPQYMAPEQATADEIDGRTDLYCVGMMFYELLEGHPPFTATSVVEVLEKQILQPTPKLKNSANQPLDEFIGRITAKARQDRYASAKEASRALDTIYRRMCQTNMGAPSMRRDPSRSAGTDIPAVNEQMIDVLAGRLRQSQNMLLVDFEADEGGPVAAPVSQAKATHAVLQQALEGDLRLFIPDLLEGGRGAELIPELLLLLWKSGRKDAILELAPDIESRLPAVPAIPFFAGLCHSERGDYEKGRSCFAVAVALDTSHVPAQIHLANCLLKLERLPEAREVLRRAALLNPSSVLAAVRHAEFLSGPAKDYQAAVAAYEKAISLAPDRMELRSKLGAILCKLDQVEEAEAVAREITEWTRDPNQASELNAMIQRRRSGTRGSKTSERLPVIRQLLPFEETGVPEQAKTATKNNPAIPPLVKPRLELMRLAVASRKWLWLLDIYKQGLKLHPDISQFHLAFGQAALQLEHPREAAEAFRETLRLKPDSRKAREGLARAEQRPGG